MNPLKLASLLNQLQSEVNGVESERPDILDRAFIKQTAFIEDPAKLKAAFCTRRAGKSYGAGTLIFEAADKFPGASILYIALTRDSAKKIMWKDVVKTINRKHGLGCKFNETELTATLPSGTVIYLTGADAKPEEMEKLLGQKYALVVIDEAASYKIDLERMVYGILKPAVADYEGTIAIIGTPGNITKGLFFDITTGKRKGWSLHKWTAFDNPHMARQWKAEIDQLTADNPGIIETPLFKQMYLGEWFVDASKLVYRFDETKNRAQALPLKKRYYYVLGVDLGYDPDPSAFVLCAYTDHDPHLYVLETYKRTKMIVTDVVARVEYYLKKYENCKVIVDAGGGGKQVAESVSHEITRRFGIPLQAAEKQDKQGFIEIMNSDLLMGKIKVLPEAGDDLPNEWQSLIWDDDGARRVEHSACENHLADAALYAWRYCYNYAFTPEKKRFDRYNEDDLEVELEKEAERMAEDAKKPFWERL